MRSIESSLLAESLVSVGLPGLEGALGMLVVIPELLGGEANGDGRGGSDGSTNGDDGLGDITNSGHDAAHGELRVLGEVLEVLNDLVLEGLDIHAGLSESLGVGSDGGGADSLDEGLKLGLNISLKLSLGLDVDSREFVGLGEVLEAGGLNDGSKSGDESDSHGDKVNLL